MSDHSFGSSRDMVFEGHFVMILPWFRLFEIQGEKCAFCAKANRKQRSTNQKNDYHTHALYPTPGPQGSCSVCLGTFSLSGPWLDWREEPSAENRGRWQKWMGCKDPHLSKAWHCQLHCGEPAGGVLPRLPRRSLQCVCQDMPGHLQEGPLYSHLNLQPACIQQIMKNGISTK